MPLVIAAAAIPAVRAARVDPMLARRADEYVRNGSLVASVSAAEVLKTASP
jgi:hypothetical protein